MLAKSLSEISPGRNLASWKHSLIVLPPKTSRTFQVICGISDLVIFSYVRRTQLMSDATEPVICIKWLNRMMKGRWVQANEVMNGCRPFELMCMFSLIRANKRLDSRLFLSISNMNSTNEDWSGGSSSLPSPWFWLRATELRLADDILRNETKDGSASTIDCRM